MNVSVLAIFTQNILSVGAGAPQVNNSGSNPYDITGGGGGGVVVQGHPMGAGSGGGWYNGAGGGNGYGAGGGGQGKNDGVNVTG